MFWCPSHRSLPTVSRPSGLRTSAYWDVFCLAATPLCWRPVHALLPDGYHLPRLLRSGPLIRTPVCPVRSLLPPTGLASAGPQACRRRCSSCRPPMPSVPHAARHPCHRPTQVLCALCVFACSLLSLSARSVCLPGPRYSPRVGIYGPVYFRTSYDGPSYAAANHLFNTFREQQFFVLEATADCWPYPWFPGCGVSPIWVSGLYFGPGWRRSRHTPRVHNGCTADGRVLNGGHRRQSDVFRTLPFMDLREAVPARGVLVRAPPRGEWIAMMRARREAWHLPVCEMDPFTRMPGGWDFPISRGLGPV